MKLGIGSLLNPLKIKKIGDLEIEIMRSFPVPRQVVFDCLTKPDLLKAWMMVPEGWNFIECKVDLRVRGKFRFVWQNADGIKMGVGGVYKSIQAPEKLVNTELVEGGPSEAETVATIILEESNGKTLMQSSVKYTAKQIRDKAYDGSLEAGLAISYNRLEALCLSLRK